MDCDEARGHLCDLNRGRLDAGTEAAVRAHLAGCRLCTSALQVEARVRALVQAQAPRYPAPPALRARVQALLSGGAAPQPAVRGMPWRDRLRGHPWAVGSLAGAVAVLAVVWAGWLWLARDPVSLLADRAVAEHLEYVKEMMNRPAADPRAVMRALEGQVDFAFEPVFPGDPQAQLVAGMVTDLRGKRAATFVYRDGSGRYTTLFLMPGAGTVIPDGGRMPIETFRPYHRVASGRQLLLWKQRNLTCLLVSDLDEAGMAAMFLKIRKTV